MSGKVNFTVEGALARILLNRPEKLNALDPDMLTALEEAVANAERSPAVRVILLEAAGPKAFCVGADVLAWSRLSALSMWSDWVRRGHRVLDLLEHARLPVICAIQGYAMGGGLELALACDVRIAADSARFGMPEVRLGTVPGWGGTRRLPELIGSARAKQMVFTGEQVDAGMAERWGLVNEVVPSASLQDRAAAIAAQVAANAPVAVQTAKQLLSSPSAGALESLAAAVNAFSDDAREGLAAFREKRSPRFEGH